MPSSSSPSSNNSPSSSTSGSDPLGSGNASASNPPLSSGSGTSTGNSGTSTAAKAGPTTTSATTTKKTAGNNPWLTSLPSTSCSTKGSPGTSGNQSQTNHKERHHTGGNLGSSTSTKIYKHYEARPTRNQNSSLATPSGTGTGSNRTYDGPHGPKKGDEGAGQPIRKGTCADSHFGAYGKDCEGGKTCMMIQEHVLFCRHGYLGESYSKYEGCTKVMHKTEIKVIREPSSVQYNGPSLVVLLSPNQTTL